MDSTTTGRTASAAHDATSSARESGTVRKFDEGRGFGFIATDRHDSVFVHYTGIRKTAWNSGPRGRRLEQGQRVTFLLEHDQHGRPRAIDVTEE